MNEQDIPIEITATKLLDWLESRKIVGKNWQLQVRDIRAKISNALNDMPEHEDLVKLLSGEFINYFHCLEIIEILKQTEKDTRSLFGRYGSQRMVDWQQVVKAYEKDSIYLAEAAQIYQRSNAEVPGLRRHRTKITQLIDDAQQRIRDLVKSEENVVAERTAICQQLGIAGNNLRQEFEDRIKELPNLYRDLAADLPTIRKAIDAYIDFAGNAELLPLIRHILRYGNTTVYQYVYCEAPVSVEEPPISIKLSPEYENNLAVNNEIDFSLDGINFDDVGAADGGEIDFGDITVESGSIDWSEGVDEGVIADADITLEESGIVVAKNNGIARGDEALSLLDSTTHRDQFMDELFELEAFLQMRQHELKSDNSNSFVFSLIDRNTKHDLNNINEWLVSVQSIIQSASSELIDHLHRLKHSTLYADILAGKLQQHLLAAEKMSATRRVLKEKIETLQQEKVDLKPVIVKTINRSKTLQKQIEQDISKRYKGRVVYVYGGVELDAFDKN